MLDCATSLKAQDFLFDFEDGSYQFWTCIDADNDDDCWWIIEQHFNCNQHILFLDDITLTYDPTGVEEHPSGHPFTLYPNPVKDKLTVESGQMIDHYEVYSILGEKVSCHETNAAVFEINVNELPQGVYFIRLHSDGMIQTKRFIKGS